MNFKTAAAVSMFLGAKVGLNVNDVEEFLAGMIQGLIEEDDFTKIQKCLTDATTLEGELEAAIADFEKKDLADILAGVKIIGNIFTELPADLGHCQDMQADLDRIEAWAAIFQNPTALAKALQENLMKNISNVEQDIMKLTADVKTDEMFYAGEDIADLLVQSLGPVPAAGPEDLKITQW